MNRKIVIKCHSEAEMNHKADSLLERGYQVERETGVVPIPSMCFTTYQVVYWK